jgi:Zn-dependent protease
LFILVSIGTVPNLLRSSEFYGLPETPHGTTVSSELLVIFTPLLIRIIFGMPPILALLYGMAWWTAKMGKSSARGWAIAASTAMLVSGIPLLYGSYLILRDSSDVPIEVLILNGLPPAIGILGLVVFAPRNALASTDLQVARPARIPGDGTNRFLDALGWLLGIAGCLVGIEFWEGWAYSRDLPPSHFLSSWMQWLLALVIVIAVHEFSHAAAGMALGMKVRSFALWPFQWFIDDGRWKFKFHPTKFLAGGAAGIVPSSANQSRWAEVCMVAAGPLANLLTGLLALFALLAVAGSPYEKAWYFLASFSILSLVLFVVNLIPFRPDSAYSDSARIYQLLRGGPLADLHKAFNLAASIWVTSLRPRDYDIHAIERSARAFSQGQGALFLRLFAYNYFHDCGRIPEACQALDGAESIYHQSASDIPAEWYTLFVFGNAFLKRDGANARRWWERIEAQAPGGLGEVYWLAQSALNWIENNLEEANEAWNKGDVLAQKRPKAGGYEFNRDCFSQLRQVLDEAPASAAN